MERPPGPNLRSLTASTAARLFSWWGGQKPSITPFKPVSKDTVRNFGAHEKSPRVPTQQRFNETEFVHVIKPGGKIGICHFRPPFLPQ
jgi:hypothetical protein